jgi:biotin carboxylase
MTEEIGPEQIVLVGFSKTLLLALAGELPAGCAVVIEEPDVAKRRDVETLATEHPAVARIVRWEYQLPGAIATLLEAEPSLAAARAVLPGIEYAVTAAADLAQQIGLPGAGSEAGLIFRDKVRQRQTAAQAGLRNPEYLVVDDAEQAIAFLQRVGGRCVVKPSARQAGLGVRLVSSVAQLEEALRDARDIPETLLPDRGVVSQILIEQAIEGPEYSVEMLVHEGRPCFSNVTAKQLAPGDFPIEVGHVVPGLPPEDARSRQLVESTARLAEASGFGDGVLHCEWIVDEQGPVLVECAARMPGDEIGTLISLAYDFPLFSAYLRILLGEEPAVPAEAVGGAAVRFLTAPAGIVQEVTGVQTAEQAPGVHVVKVPMKPGDTVHSLASSWDRAGYVLARGDSPQQAEANARAAADAVHVRTSPVPGADSDSDSASDTVA